MKKKKNFVWNIFFALVFLAGAGVFLYPTVSDMWNQYRNVRLVSRYDEAVTDLSDNEYEKLWNEAKEYNAEHPVNSIVDVFGEKDDYVLTQPYDRYLIQMEKALWEVLRFRRSMQNLQSIMA